MVTRYVKVADLPPVIRRGLDAIGYRRADVPLTVGETFRSGAYSDGTRAVVVAVPLNGGPLGVTRGSWGGSNAFVRTAADDVGGGPIPSGFAVVSGVEGGTCYATLYLRPENVAHLLPAGPTVTPRQAAILAVHSGLTSAGRKDYFSRQGSASRAGVPVAKVTEAEIAALVAAGFLKRNSAGAVSVTTEGKNAAAYVPSGWSTCYDLPVDGVSWEPPWKAAQRAQDAADADARALAGAVADGREPA